MKVSKLESPNGGSFYGKALVIKTDEKLILQSYETQVAEYDFATQTLKVNGNYSKTTTRHINAFKTKLGIE